MSYVLWVVSGVFTILSRMIFYDTFLIPKKDIKRQFIIWSVIVEIILIINSLAFAGTYNTLKYLIMVSFNVAAAIALTFFYSANKFRIRILVALLMFSICGISEFITGTFLSIVNPRIFETPGIAQDACVTVISNILYFFIFILICRLWKNHSQNITTKYIIMTCATPACSILILILTPYQVLMEHNILVFVIQLTLLALNIINYFMLDEIIKQISSRQQLENQEKQLAFQADKYEQLSSVYKQSRSIIHELKRYNSFIIGCIESKQYDRIVPFIKQNSDEIEKRFTIISSGNIVVDTLISSCKSFADDNRIGYTYNIDVDTKSIPLSDYDLCVILGNLIDNSINACRELLSKAKDQDMNNSKEKNNKNNGDSNNNYSEENIKAEDIYILVSLFVKDRFFVIHIENSCPAEPAGQKNSAKKDDMLHGFGLINIQNTVEKYQGLYYQDSKDSVYETTISIPFFKDAENKIISV